MISLKGQRRHISRSSHDYDGVSEREQSSSKGESLVAVVQVRRQLKQSDVEMLKGIGDSQVTTVRLWNLGHWIKLLLLKEVESRGIRFSQYSIFQRLVPNKCLINVRITAVGKCASA